MEFWGVEVKPGQVLLVDPEEDYCLHLSQAALGEIKKDKGSQYVCLYLKHGDKKLVIGSLSHDKFPQISFDLVLAKPFELSHNLKDGSVFFAGYKVQNPGALSEGEDSENESEEVVLPQVTNNGKPEASGSKPAGAKKPDSTAGKQKVNFVEPKKDVKPQSEESDSDSDDEDDSDNSSDEEEDSSDDQDEDEDTSDEDEDTTPKDAAGPSKKRSVESGTKTPTNKKAKLVTPDKSDGKKPSGSGHVHVATPYPHKGKEAKQQPQKTSGGLYPCKTCNRLFTTPGALNSHTKDKHDA